MILILMGVSGSGKSTIGHMLAEKLQWTFEDGDDYHPPSNKTKMSSGVPLDDTDRHQWLLNLNSIIQRWQRSNQHGIIVCSALKLKYRQVLLSGRSAKYFDTDVSSSSNFKQRHSQDVRTDSTSEMESTHTEVDQLQVGKQEDHLPHQSLSTQTASVQDVATTLHRQQEEHHYIAKDDDCCGLTGCKPPLVLFVHLKSTMELISSRLSERKGHFFNPGLLQSQFDTLEELGADEDGLVVDVSNSLDSVVSQIRDHVLTSLSEPI
ncbi:probable gluconokinase [Strongylocentrotus purpuratus]|uniref:gluconokinase n=1 Tax=Strongylocentrotus purpuratus TaxID=7668 RepID=A0A7M7HHP8_STRPU|nr:probable gluconokinase [Strongylocentrotus purpuratus]